ncbi:YD repeat-containing protein [Aquimarina sp. MAR_2010_214]|uniref:RHS repeat protein n=1 Tax=Aquimarina sp. MAR_2010_214 TaxID=1250026 RepID=UPI000C70EB1B|nr:RHS repeat domain-containing protein [Aquimarina sp. MAR_2010_214]PKV50678.1 YD repeat-containing protein [Aquimarina sp. MAR_2010_214]
MLKQAFLIAVLLVGISSIAQELPKIIPPSPNASSLGKYGQVPVGLFTGTPQINIPLYTLKTGKLSVPISLDYSSNGIRVDQLPSNVGLSWSLRAGGVITRVIMDDPDETSFIPLPSNFPGAYTREVLDYLINATKPEDGGDTLSDIYSFSINGFSGKFYLDSNRVPVIINPSPVKIEKGVPGYAFKVTDPNGIIYWFGNDNSTESTMFQHVGSGQHGWSLENENSWYLSKMTSLQGDEINFTYTNFHQEYYSGVSQSIENNARTGNITVPGQGIIQTRSMTSIAQLSSITSNTGRVDFTYSINNSASNKLDAVEIKDVNGVRIKKFALGYENVISSLQTLKNKYITHFDEYNKRLFLTSVTEYGKGTNSKPPYVLSYYSPDKIPPRFSYAQDYWGYYNGVTNNNYLVSDGDYFFYTEENTIILKNLFKSIGGNKKPNGEYSRNGMLKKITYPTGGFNELIYEPHSYTTTVLTNPPPISRTRHVENKEDEFGDSKEFTTDEILFTQNQTNIGMTTRRTSCWPDRGGSDHHIKASLSVQVANQGSSTFNVPPTGEGIYSLDYNGNKIPHTGGLVVAEGSPGIYHIDLQKGKRYRFTVSVQFECVGGDFNISYYDSPPYDVETEIEVGGQRLQKTITDDGKGKQEIKKYHYGELSDLDSSSGIAEKPIPSISYSRRFSSSTGALILNQTQVDVLTLSSSTLHNLYSRAGHQIGYTSVVEELGENFGNGGITHKFRVIPNTNPLPFGLSISGTPYDTNFGTGEEIETRIVQKVGNHFNALQKTTNTYYNNPVLNKEQPSYNVRLRDTYSGYNYEHIVTSISSFDIVKYFVKSQWRYLNKTITEHYNQNEENLVTTTTNYFYDNPDHLQVTRTETTSSENKKVIAKTIYPQDVEIKTPAINKLIGQHRIAEPIQQETVIKEPDGTILSKSTQLSTYKDWGNNIVLPEFVKTLKGNLSLSNPLENRVQYHKYDAKGNPVEVSKANGTHITYIWGYQDTFPIAKIENATRADITAYVTDLKAKSNADNDNCTAATCKEQILRVALQALRDALPNAMVSTYTYDPLIGITSMTDANGYTMTYHYDELNRLIYVKDADGNLVSENKYNYKNQQ